jgi:malignant T-cell-amplified sequence
MSKSSRDELMQELAKMSRNAPIKSKQLKIAEGDDPTIGIVFDETERLYLGTNKQAKGATEKAATTYFPLLKDAAILPERPSVVVDSGAVKFVVNGANIMRPGIRKIEGEDFQAGDIVVVKEEKYGKAIAVGKAKLSKSEMEQSAKGPVVENLHYAGDKFWNMLKEIP